MQTKLTSIKMMKSWKKSSQAWSYAMKAKVMKLLISEKKASY